MATKTTYRWFVQSQNGETDERIVALIPGCPENENLGPKCADGIHRPLLELPPEQLRLVYESRESHNLTFKPFRQVIGPKTSNGGQPAEVPFFVLKAMFHPRVQDWKRRTLHQLKAKAQVHV